MALIIQKFNNTLMSDASGVKTAASRILQAYRNKDSVVAVVSAPEAISADLLKTCAELYGNPSRREADMLLSTAEQAAIALLAIALEGEGCPVISLTGHQAGIMTDSAYGKAWIKSIDTERIYRELDKHNVVVVAGGQGWNRYGDITTLGPGGPETSAVALAAELKADACEIYLEDSGVFTADKEIVKDAVRLHDISYDELLELYSLGADVIHSRSIELAKKYDITVVLKSIECNDCNTVIKEAGKVEKLLVRGVTRDTDVARISVLNIEDRPGMAFKLFSMLAKKGISVDIIIQSAGRDEATKDISFTVSKKDLDSALAIIKDNFSVIGAKDVIHSDKYAKVSIVGAGMVNHPEIAPMMFEALYDADINIHMITTSEIKISVLVDVQEAERAVNSIHKRFKLDELYGD